MTDSSAMVSPSSATAEPLPALSATLFSGTDCAEFLQGYMTCDSNSLLQPAMAGQGLAAALCNIKGRVIANGWAFALPQQEAADAIVLITHASVAEAVREHLTPYMVFSKTSAQALPEPVLGLVDQPASAPWIRLDARRQLALPTMFNASVDEATRDPSAGQFMGSLIDDRRVLVNAECSATYLPQMLGLGAWGAIDFGKGCYLGQEVVARAEHRGQVKRQLLALVTVGNPAPVADLAPGATVRDENGKTLGKVVATRGFPATAPGIAALAVINAANLDLNAPLTVDGYTESMGFAS